MDVLIAGAGPAGAVAGIVLARAGARVTIVDRTQFPRDKLCGDTINPGALTILRRLGLAHVTVGGLRVDGMVVSGGAGDVRVIGPYGAGRCGIALPRRVLDARLVEAAAAAGARIEEGISVTRPLLTDDGRRVEGVEIRTSNGTTEKRFATVTIAADGASSRLARAVGLVRTPPSPRRWAIGALFEGVADLTTFGEMHVRERCYVGVAPLPGRLANSCVVTADREALRTRDLLLRTLAADPALRARFMNARIVSGPASMGPLAVDAIAAGMPGLLLAGDAAGFVDPMTGDGLRFAFKGAELAAHEAVRVLESGWADAHERLAAARGREFSVKWRFNRALRTLAASPSAIRGASTAARLSPALLRGVIRYAGDVSAA